MQTALIVMVVLFLAVAVFDLVQKKHAILRNFPILGHFRYMLESIGPELRQYIVTSNDEERPFNRDQRSWVYASAKKQNNYFGFGSDNDMEMRPNYLIFRHSAFPIQASHPKSPEDTQLFEVPAAKVLGGPRGRQKAFRPRSIVNISAMSYGSLSAPAVEAINRGSAVAGCLHNTGEGGVSSYHQKGGELVWQIGTGYFGCRTKDGGFDLEKFQQVVESNPIRAIEIKFSQGAKPGLGGMLPKEKITAEIAEIRGIPRDQDCVSPSGHTAFHDVDSLLDFVELLAEKSGGLPIGIKSAVGQMAFWVELAEKMQSGERGVDFITIDGGEGGTGAAPLVFADHVALPFKIAITQVYRIFVERGLAEQVTFIGSGKLGFPEDAILALALGCDQVNIAREAMLAVGCIQAQRCHTGHCPTGVATQNKWLVRGLDPSSKSHRLANYVITLRKELLRIAHACGYEHPSLIDLDAIEILDDRFRSRSARDWFDYERGWGLPGEEDKAFLESWMQHHPEKKQVGQKA